MPRLINARERFVDMLVGETPWGPTVLPYDQSAVVLAIAIPDQSFARNSRILIKVGDDVKATWSIEDAISRSRRCDLLGESLKKIGDVERIMLLAVFKDALSTLAEGHMVKFDRAVIVPPRQPLSVIVEGDPENRPIRFMLKTLCARD